MDKELKAILSHPLPLVIVFRDKETWVLVDALFESPGGLWAVMPFWDLDTGKGARYFEAPFTREGDKWIGQDGIEIMPLSATTGEIAKQAGIQWQAWQGHLIEFNPDRQTVVDAAARRLEEFKEDHMSDLLSVNLFTVALLLFEEEPLQWGLRGDPYLWEEMKDHFSEATLPETPGELKLMIESAFELLTEKSISEEGDFLIERYSHGGMSSGYISPEFWRNEAIPELVRRYTRIMSNFVESQTPGGEINEPLGIDLGDGNRRIMAEVFLSEGGLVFADIGWSDPSCSFNPFHYIEGEITGEDPWCIGEYEIFMITRDDVLYREWEYWEKAKAELGDSSREAAYKSIINGGLPGVDIFE